VTIRHQTPDAESMKEGFTTPKPSFAFYGRVSTEDNQDPESSRRWQISIANNLIARYEGSITSEFFDVGQSRSLPWQRRPEANRLLTALRDPQRGFTAVVIGEPHRAFYGNQFGLTLPLSPTIASSSGYPRSAARSIPTTRPTIWSCRSSVA
jgi:hypothetical protein